MPTPDVSQLPEGREWFSPEDLAEWLGLPEGSIYQWNSRGKAPRRVRFGRHVRYRRRDIEHWIKQHYVDDDEAA